MAQYESEQARKGRAAASSKPPPSAKTPPRITPLDEIAGRVADVNASLRFLVIEFPLGTLPKLDQRMAVYREGQKVAEVKIDKWTQGLNVVADITAGEARIGDDVRNN
jgi:hypothetical protein